MSKPDNRLAAFSSYNYYHVLAMCDCSQTADELANASAVETWEHGSATEKPAGTADLGKYSVKRTTSGGRYCILIHGASNAAYVISSAQWTSATAASAVPGDQATSIALEGRLMISEPKGIAFLDQVIRCSVELGVDSSQAVYALKTFFVGFGNDPRTGEYVEHIVDVPPVNFIAYDVTGSFTVEGGSYEMQFVGVANGASRLPQYSKSVSGMSIKGESSLAGTMTKLQDNINRNYEKYYECVVSQLRSGQGNGYDPEPVIDALRKVTYEIEMSDDYKLDIYTVTDQADQYKNTSGCNDSAQITFPAHTSIETAISHIMTMSPQVREDMKSGDSQTGRKYEYKIHTAVISRPVSGEDVTRHHYTVRYRIVRFESPKSVAGNGDFEVLQQVDVASIKTDPRYEKLRRNIIEFDYLYTGQNVDILDFDMKVNMGLVYLQTATLANTFKRQTDRAASKLQAAPNGAWDSVGGIGTAQGKLVEIPVFFGSQIRSPQFTNTNDATTAIESAYTLTKHASIEVAEATMKIVGNDRLLGSTNRSSSGYSQELTSTLEKSEQIVGAANFADFHDWTHAPAFAKVNIKMPRSNDDTELMSITDSSGSATSLNYAQDFWFDGYYYVYGIDHNFDNGEFTQTLQMLGLPRRSAFEASRTPQAGNVDTNTATGNCFENKIGCGPTHTSATSPGSPHVGQTTTAPITADNPDGVSATTREDAEAAVVRAGTSPSNVKNWDTATPEVRKAIVNAASQYGLDPTLLAQIAYVESSLKPSAAAKTSQAQGLFQFIPDTWRGMIRQNQIPAIANLPPSEQLAARNDPAVAAQAAAVFTRNNQKALRDRYNQATAGDTYLYHFMGQTRAKLILDEAATPGGDKTLLSNVLSSSALEKVRAANPQIFAGVTTVGDLRAATARKMANALKSPIDVVAQPLRTTDKKYGSANGGEVRAKDAVAMQQNCGVQQEKKDLAQCGKTVDNKPQDTTKK